MVIRLVSVLPTIGVMLCGQSVKALAAEPKMPLQGVWRFEANEVDGTPRPALPFESNKVIILRDGRFVIMQGKSVTHGTMKIDSSKTPKQYDSTIVRGPARGMTFPCIYELSGDTFKLCGPYRPGERPTEFVTKPGSGLVMQVLKREKQSVPDALNDAARKELEGAWLGKSCVRDGKPDMEDAAKKAKLTFDAVGMISEIASDGAPMTASTKIDALTDPMKIDFAYSKEPMKGKTSRALAQVDGETLTICSAEPGKERPTELSSKPGSGWWLTTYQRGEAEKK